MDIREIRTERIKLEERIRDCILEFEAKTDLVVESVTVNRMMLMNENGPVSRLDAIEAKISL